MAVLHVTSNQTAEISWRPRTFPVSSLKPVVPTSAWGSRVGQLIWIPAGWQAFLLGFCGLFVHNSSTFCHLLLFIRWLKVLVLKKKLCLLSMKKEHLSGRVTFWNLATYVIINSTRAALIFGIPDVCVWWLNHYHLLGKMAISNFSWQFVQRSNAKSPITVCVRNSQAYKAG